MKVTGSLISQMAFACSNFRMEAKANNIFTLSSSTCKAHWLPKKHFRVQNILFAVASECLLEWGCNGIGNKMFNQKAVSGEFEVNKVFLMRSPLAFNRLHFRLGRSSGFLILFFSGEPFIKTKKI